ncbi:S-layer protein [Neobacillus sp. SAB-20_R2A]|uniref:S-layer protein n=1 Tax=Neobacillus sp. SAB-20_R2A TaxID=3120519 RepID=UPI003C6E11C6
MKKWFSIFIFGLIFLFTQPVNAQYYEVQKVLKVYKEPSFNSQSVESVQPGEVWIEYTSSSGWMRLSNERWIAPEGAKVTIDRTFEAYDTPSLESQKLTFAPQIVIAHDGAINGLLLIDTWAGAKWTGVNGMPHKMSETFAAFDYPGSTTPVAWFAPQTVYILKTTDTAWSQINTYLGPKWIIRFPHYQTINRTFCAYSSPRYSNVANIFAPQSVRVLKEIENGWIQISTYAGNMWVAPKGSSMYIDRTFAAYDSPLGRYITSFAPQTVFVKEESTSPFGWLKIQTYLGDQWIQLPK